jgi:dCMP deaminase
MTTKIDPFDTTLTCQCGKGMTEGVSFLEANPECPVHKDLFDHVKVNIVAEKKCRPSVDTYFLNMAELVSTRATCDRAHVGCVLVKDKSVIGTGYNGSMVGMEHCDDVGHLMEEGHCVRTVHAEMNALVQAAKHGHATAGSTAYINTFPCWLCFKLLVNAGISRIVYSKEYRKDEKVVAAAKSLNLPLEHHDEK